MDAFYPGRAARQLSCAVPGLSADRASAAPLRRQATKRGRWRSPASVTAKRNCLAYFAKPFRRLQGCFVQICSIFAEYTPIIERCR
jgi:hypothetical protein